MDTFVSKNESYNNSINVINETVIDILIFINNETNEDRYYDTLYSKVQFYIKNYNYSKIYKEQSVINKYKYIIIIKYIIDNYSFHRNMNRFE